MTKLEKMLKYVSEHNEFYKNRIKEYGIKDPLDITQWPVLTRKELQENRYNMFSFGCKSKFFSQQLRRQYSSGSSGIPINVYWLYKDYYASTLSLWRQRARYYGIHTNDRMVKFTMNAYNITPENNTIHYINDPNNVLTINASLIHNEDEMLEIVKLINNFEPVWFYIQPFILNRLIRCYQTHNIRPPTTLRYIETVGELLPSDIRRRAIEFFGVRLANMYGTEEMNGIAYECPHHSMHILTDNVFVECLTPEGTIEREGQGQAIVTNLNNTAMPLVRYNQGDIISLTNQTSPYPCRNCAPIISLIEGRKMDELIIEGATINTYLLVELIAELNNTYNDIITDFKFVYHNSLNMLVCYIHLTDNKNMWFESVAEDITQLFWKKQETKMELRFDVLPFDPNTETNKKFCVLEVKE